MAKATTNVDGTGKIHACYINQKKKERRKKGILTNLAVPYM